MSKSVSQRVVEAPNAWAEKFVSLVERYRSKRKQSPKLARFTSPALLFVLWPTLVFAAYQILWASPRYESRVQITIQQPDSGPMMDPATMMMLGSISGAGVSSLDAFLVQAYIQSTDMMTHLNTELGLKAHYQSDDADMFSVLSDSASQEDFFDFYQSHVEVEVDEISGIIKVRAQAFDPAFSQQITQEIKARAEWYINYIGYQLAEAQVQFNEAEKLSNLQKLQDAQARLIEFQQRYDLLDPEAEGMALQQITYNVEAEISSKQAELGALRSTMTDSAPAVMAAKSQLESLNTQLELVRSRLAAPEGVDGERVVDGRRLSVGEILARYADFKLDVEIALTAYATSQASLEQARVDAYRKMKYLVVLESPTLAEDNAYPEVLYNILLLLVVLGGIFAIGRIVIATIEELR